MTPATPSPVVAALADRVWQHRLAHEPFTRVQRGLPVERLRAGSLAELEADASLAAGVLVEMAALDETALVEDDRLTVGFLQFLLQGWVDAPRHHWHSFSVAPYSSYFLGHSLRHVFSSFTFDAPADVDRYLTLVADYRSHLLEAGRKLDGQRERGILVPRPALAGIRTSLTRFRTAADALLTPSAERTAPLSTADAGRLRDATQTLLADGVLPAYDALLAQLGDGYDQEAGDLVGMCHQPGGEGFYREAVRVHTASDWSPERLHEVGLDEVQRLADEMAKARADMGFSGSEAEFHAQLKADPALHADAPADVEVLYLRHMQALEPHLPRLFARLPEARYGVRRLAPEMEAGMTFGYYQVPTPSDPVGYYVYNGSDLAHRSLLTAAALILHELAPGHHFHMARQSEDTGLPDVRRESMDIGAFNEGWAEYAAGLGWETGLYDAPLDGYGRLVHERFTAQRLVVDTGLNLLGWSLARASEYARANTTDSEVQIATEMIRYSTDLPGQALAYRAGFLELQRLRAEAERVLGPRFDLRDFHEQVLSPGALPFPVLEGHLCRWVAAA